jgi:hypothetical protein
MTQSVILLGNVGYRINFGIATTVKVMENRVCFSRCRIYPLENTKKDELNLSGFLEDSRSLKIPVFTINKNSRTPTGMFAGMV